MSRLYIREIETCLQCGHFEISSYSNYYHCKLSDKDLTKNFDKKIPRWCKLEKVAKCPKCSGRGIVQTEYDNGKIESESCCECNGTGKR